MNKPWYTIKAKTPTTAEVWIYEEIGETWFGEGITARNFVRDLNGLDVEQIDLHINSPGGSVFDGQAIYNALVRHKATITTYIDGLAGSIASVIALAGDTIRMPSNAMMMIHNPWGMAVGYAEDMRQMAEALDKIGETILNVYEEHSIKDRAELQMAMAAETWLTAEDAVAYGFISEVAEPVRIAAHFDLGRFQHPPAFPTEEDLEPAPTEDTPPGIAQTPASPLAQSETPPRQDWVPIPTLGRAVPFAPRQK